MYFCTVVGYFLLFFKPVSSSCKKRKKPFWTNYPYPLHSTLSGTRWASRWSPLSGATNWRKRKRLQWRSSRRKLHLLDHVLNRSMRSSKAAGGKLWMSLANHVQLVIKNQITVLSVRRVRNTSMYFIFQSSLKVRVRHNHEGASCCRPDCARLCVSAQLGHWSQSRTNNQGDAARPRFRAAPAAERNHILAERREAQSVQAV